MKIEINETGKKNVVYISYNEIIDQANDIMENTLNGSLKMFKENFAWDISNLSDESIVYLKSVLDKITMLRKASKTCRWYVDGILLEYSKRNGYVNYILDNAYNITWSEKLKQRQNLVSLIEKSNYKLSNLIWDKISISSWKFYDALSANDFPEEIVDDILRENGFLMLDTKISLSFQYDRLVNWLNLNLDIDFVFYDLKEAFYKMNKPYIIGLMELSSYLSDIEDTYDYIKWKFAKLSNDYLIDDLNFENWFFKETKTDTVSILPVNKDWLTFLEIIADNNILSRDELIEIIWSRSKLYQEDMINYSEEAIDIRWF